MTKIACFVSYTISVSTPLSLLLSIYLIQFAITFQKDLYTLINLIQSEADFFSKRSVEQSDQYMHKFCIFWVRGGYYYDSTPS